MQTKLLEILACPDCLSTLSCLPSQVGADQEIDAGTLECSGCGRTFPIESGIPRFVESDNYSASFGYQWNLFKSEQLDSVTGTRLSETRLFSETAWTPEWMNGKWVLDAGCGAGRFLDVASNTGAQVVGIDISNAVDAARGSLKGRPNVHFVQASLYELPFRTGAFHGCYCIGVIQHTPEPQNALRALPRVLRAGGRIAVTIYERKPWTWLNMKYLVRPLTKRMDKQTLLATIRRVMPVLFPLSSVMSRIPLLGPLLKFAIPVANYTNERALTTQQRYDWERALTTQQRYDWAVLDTFDMLSPQYDQPQTYAEVERALSAAGIVDVRRLPNSGLNLVGVKRA